MKEDILKFRKICNILIDEGRYSKLSICTETGMSEPTLQKLLTNDLDDLKGVRASTLGMIQDFIKKHIDALTYEGIKSPANESETKEKIDSERKSGKRLGGKTRSKVNGSDNPGSVLENIPNLFDLLIEALKSIPSNVCIRISINEKIQ